MARGAGRAAGAAGGRRRGRLPLRRVAAGGGIGRRRGARRAGRRLDAATASPGPRFFHFVIGGSTPAALGADWLATAARPDRLHLGHLAASRTRLETVSVALAARSSSGCPPSWGGVLTTGRDRRRTSSGSPRPASGGASATGVDVDARRDWPGCPPVPVLASGYVHASARQGARGCWASAARQRPAASSRDAVGRHRPRRRSSAALRGAAAARPRSSSRPPAR